MLMPLLTGILAIVSLIGFAWLPLAGAALGMLWLPIAVTFVGIPMLDAMIGRPQSAVPPPAPLFVRWIPRLQLILQAVLLVEAVRIAPSLSWPDLAVFAVAVGGATGALGITIAHELGHRASRLDRTIAKALLISVGYGHFQVEHIRGHHARVATPDDPASAPIGMNVYRFLLRSLVGSFRHAWQLEAMRLAHRGRSAWHPTNWTLTGSLLSLALLAAAAAAAGPKGAVLFVGQAAWAVILLEVVNYIEHYGLRRKRIEGRYEQVGPAHSWDADFVISNWILFNLQRHADHHAHVRKAYETLEATDDAPQLPAGYPTLVPIALTPPLWFALMNSRVPSPEPDGA